MRSDDKMGIADMNVDFCNKKSTKPSWKETMRENLMWLCLYKLKEENSKCLQFVFVFSRLTRL